MPTERHTVMSLMRKAVKAGQSRTSFFRDMKAEGLSYVRKTMIADWSSIKDFIAKDGALRQLRKNAYPPKKHIVTTEWDIEGEYMYKIKVLSRLRPDEPITERFVNIVTDKPMTPRMMEQAVIGKWAEWEDYTAEAIEEIVPWTAIRTTI